MNTWIVRFQEWLIGKSRLETLYRYTPHTNCCRRDEVIMYSRLWFSRPDDFNDPLDSRLDYRQEYSTEEIESFWRGFLKRKPDHPQSLDEILQRWGSSQDFVEQQNRVFNQFRSQMGVACFSKTPTNILMWSHYANNHKGIVYEFESNLFINAKSEYFAGNHIRVEYMADNEYELLSYALSGKSKEEQFKKELTTKAVDWAYEQEYRFIDLKGNGNKPFKKESLKSVIFGAKTPPEEIERFRQLCQQYGFGHVQFKKARFSQGKFKIEIVDI